MKRSDFIFLLVSTVILVISWVVFNIIHQAVSSTVSQTTSQAILPIDGKFDSSVIDSLKTRMQVSPIFGQITETPIPTATPAPFIPLSTTAPISPVIFKQTPTATVEGGITP